MTFTRRLARAASGCPSGYIGTSMAAPHVSATAALVIASGVLGPHPTPGRRSSAGWRRPRATSAPPGRDPHYGSGLLDAGRATDPRRAGHVVRTISTEQGAWCETLFGTEPSRNRRAPVMPLLPTTIRSAPRSSATSRIASAGSPSRAKVSTSSAGLAHHVGGVAQRRVDLLARVDHPLQVGRRLPGLLAQAGLRDRLVGGDEHTAAPTDFARSIASSTALRAVSEPSVPTTIDRNMAAIIATARAPPARRFNRASRWR